MLVYGIGAQRAFDVLAWRSQQTNIKLRDLAEQLAADARALTAGDGLRHAFDHLLLTAHTRVDRPGGQ